MFLGKMTRAGIGMIAALGLSTSIASAQESVEVLHWWTSGGEAKALQVLKKDLEDQGVSWNDMPVAGGGGEQAMTVLRARVTSGNAPTASDCSVNVLSPLSTDPSAFSAISR